MVPKISAFVLIVIVAFCLRFYRYEYFPIGGETADESAWTYLGASLLDVGQPTSWSFFSPYSNGYIYLDRGVDIAPLVRPSLDHPPLFSLIPGAAHLLRSGDWEVFPSLKVTRLPMVILGTINVALLMLVASRLFKKDRWVFLAGIIYATAPSFVFSSRLVVSENLLVTWTLLAVWALLSRTKWWLPTVVLACAAAVMTKISGVALPAAIIFYGLGIKNKQVMSAGIIGLIGGVLSLILYGAYFNFTLFWQILIGQASRDLGLATFYNRFLLHPSIVEKFFFDGWIFLGILATAISLYKNKLSFAPIHYLFILNLFFIVTTSGEQTFHGWYDIILYPLFVLVIVDLIKDIFKAERYLLFSLVWVLLLPVFRMVAVLTEAYYELSTLMIRTIIGMGMLPWLFSLKPKSVNRSFERWIMWLLVFLVLIANVIVVVTIDQVHYWETDLFFYFR